MIPAVKEGQILPSREAHTNTRLHHSHQRGIDGNSTDSAALIVLAGDLFLRKTCKVS